MDEQHTLLVSASQRDELVWYSDEGLCDMV